MFMFAVTSYRKGFSYDFGIRGDTPGFLDWGTPGLGENRPDAVHASVKIVDFQPQSLQASNNFPPMPI